VTPSGPRPPFSIELLESRHPRSDFSSGVEALDRYLAKQAGQDARRNFAATFVLLDRAEGRLAGYYSLSAASISLGRLPKETARRLPKYPDVPAALVGRLAVDRRFRGRGLGAVLLFDAVKRAAESELAVFAVLVDAKDDEAVAFYRKHGFIALEDADRKLFLPIETARKLLA
jgi:GNAT superfamily N-acetyltransferase